MTNEGSNINETKLKMHCTSPPWRSFDVGKLNAPMIR